ncbi:3-galactosyl-N-acetylglucosaminide 4-alpha-L-fucosyltransferase FUT3-like [Liolophura sinensis]|uniref:3-galactosyl-N-acetylglucosaminide 4-alpha-L-fucosyltransferase FUT3-like n=1 Tax=Liolophura sinensis TaxID=3198878 RepID=UPI003158E65D
MNTLRVLKSLGSKIAYVVCFILLLKLYLTQVYVEDQEWATRPPRVLQAISRRLRVLKNPSAVSKQYQRFLELRKGYEHRLVSVTHPPYRAPSDFIDIGEPIGTLLKSIPEQSNRPPGQPKLVLLWTKFYGVEQWVQDANFRYCPNVTPCKVTTNKTDLDKSDALLIHPRDIVNYSRASLPAYHPPHQRWVYFIQEPPWAVGINLADFGGVFNWTATYRDDADIDFRFSSRVKSDQVLPMPEYSKIFLGALEKKSKLVAARISNCDTTRTKRLEFIQELQKYIPVDFYGKCGTLECPGKDTGCKDKMEQYKFYLAFENSNCRSYITEKIWRALGDWNAVPVVMGGSDPRDYAYGIPPHSYIHVDGFESPKQLAEFLVLLDKNVTLYEQYFRWHRTHYTETPRRGWCQLCESLYDWSLPVKTYRDFKGWYEQDSCDPVSGFT